MKTSSWLWLFLPLLLFAGCSSSSENVAVFPGEPPASASPPPIVVSRVYLGDFVADAEIRLETLSGEVIARARANRGGTAFFHGVQVPQDFRALARLEGSSSEFSAELRGFDPRNRQALINVPTTLASRYLRAHPGTTLPEAETVVRRALNLPRVLMLDIGIYEDPVASFSHINFWQVAARQGGWEAYSQRVLAGAEQGPGTSYSLTQQDLYRPVSGLGDARLDATAEKARRRMFAWLKLPAQPAVAKSAPVEVLTDAPGSIAGQFLLGVGTGITGNLVTDGVTAVFGWAANQLGLNYGTTGQLDEIQATLNDVESELDSLVTEVTDSNLKTQLETLNGYLVPIQTATNSLITSLNSANITNLPFSPPASYSTLITDLTQPDYVNTLVNVQNGLIGPTQAIMSAQTVALNQVLGIDGPASMQSMPWRSDQILTQLLKVFKYFGNQQVQLLNLYSESAHNYQINPNPVLGINNMLPQFQQATSSLKQQRQQQPFYSGSSLFLVDYENGVMWVANMQSPCTADEACNAVASASHQFTLPDGSTVIYDDWHLPNYGEYISLQQRATYNPSQTAAPSPGTSAVPVNSHDSYPDPGQSTAGLVGLGFQNVADYLIDEDDDTGSQNGENGDMWMSWAGAQYDEYYNSWEISYATNYEFRLNHASDNTSKEQKSSDENVYLYCRTFGPNPTVNPYAQISGQGQSGAPPLPSPSPYQGKGFQTGERALYGVPTSIGTFVVSPAATPSPSPVSLPAGALQVDATVGYVINTGGSFTLGYGSGSTLSLTNPTNSHSGEVSTQDQGTGAPNLVRQLVAWGSSDPSVMSLSNLPGLDGVGIPRATSKVTLSALLKGAGGNNVTGSFTYTPTAIVNHTLTSIQISPRNQIYGTTNGQPAQGNYPYYCTGFYLDQSLATLGSSVVWTVTPSSNSAGAVVTQTSDGPVLQLAQPAQPAPSPYNLTITATANSTIVDSTTIQILAPTTPSPSPSPSPTPVSPPSISLINPTVGPAAGGTTVVLTGQNFTGATSVTFGGVAATSFVVNTAQQVTCVSPPGTGTVTVLLTTPGGTSSASFGYQ